MVSRKLISFLVVAIVGLAGGFGWAYAKLETDTQHIGQLTNRLDKSEKSQLANRASNVAVWCEGINQGRDYNRKFFTYSSKQTKEQVAVIYKALNHPSALTPAQKTFLRMYVDSVVTLEKSSKAIQRIHPYTLKDLPCKQLEAATYKSARPTR